ncbi:hypothetical protein ACFV4E_15305 [Streptomyces hygroscopicus]|uniref:Uncharacterized protein n=1 Tax=Streptomyces demainii TaxID=588122 RepID=A0ABT9KHI2_9ACTN|nr:hypothetical protein [Streptomyces demainii]MDP9607887.1 hypothetical protein [Streptomyces demainii]
MSRTGARSTSGRFQESPSETTDERLDEIEVEITRDLAGASGVVVVHGLEEYLRDLRRQLAEQSA